MSRWRAAGRARDGSGGREHDRVPDPAAPELGLGAGERWVLEQVRRHGVGAFIAFVTLTAVVATVSLVVMSLLFLGGDTDRGAWTRALAFAVCLPVIVGPPSLLLSARLVSHLDTAARLLQESVVTDPLTGVANRRGFFAVLDSLERSDRFEVAMVDVDDFKSINDERGHPAGDTALCMVAAWLEDLVGDRGIVGRLGGDEFAYVAEADPDRLPPTRMDFRLDETRFSVSIGSARAHDGDLHAALLDADAALYRQKQTRPVPPRRIVRSDQRGCDE